MTAIIKRELSSYFNSAIGYIILGLFFFFSGQSFQYYCLYLDSSSMYHVFSDMILINLFLIPLITMRSFAEEKRQKTDQALLTAPVSLFEIVMGKFIGAFTLYLLCNVIYPIYALIISLYTAPDWIALFTTMLGMLLMAAALIAIGLFISVLTESQAVAAMFSIGVGMLIYSIDTIAEHIEVDFVKDILNSISFSRHFTSFNYGIITLSGVVFFLSVCAGFLFLCSRVLEKRRWS